MFFLIIFGAIPVLSQCLWVEHGDTYYTYTDGRNIDVNASIYGDDIYVSDDIIHTGDTDTKIGFATNRILFTVGDMGYFHLYNGIFYGNGDGENIDFKWTPEGDGSLFYIDSSTSRVGINDDTPSYNLDVNGNFYANTVNTGQGNYELYAMNQDLETTDGVTFATVNTGQGNYELYAMNQNVMSNSNVQFGTINTGQGYNELYDMNQNVMTTSDVTFDDLNCDTIICNDITTLDLYTVEDGFRFWLTPEEETTNIYIKTVGDYYFMGLGVENPDTRLMLQEDESELGTGTAYDWAVYSDERFKPRNGTGILPENKVVKWIENISIFRYNPKQILRDNETNELIFGETNYSKVNVGISAQECYNYTKDEFGEIYANTIVHKPENENTTLWTLSYRNIQMIFARFTQILHERQLENQRHIKDMETFLSNYGYIPLNWEY